MNKFLQLFFLSLPVYHNLQLFKSFKTHERMRTYRHRFIDKVFISFIIIDELHRHLSVSQKGICVYLFMRTI